MIALCLPVSVISLHLPILICPSHLTTEPGAVKAEYQSFSFTMQHS